MKKITLTLLAILFLIPLATFAGGELNDYTLNPDGTVNTNSAYNDTSVTTADTALGDTNSNNFAAVGATNTPLSTGAKAGLIILGVIIAGGLIWSSIASWRKYRLPQ
jgi:hypothetical protein